MVYDYEHPDVPFDYYETQAKMPRPARVLGPLPMIQPGETIHVKLRLNGPLFTPRRGRQRKRFSWLEE